MPLWSLTKPPKYVPNAIATKEGWVDPATGELLVAIGSLNTRHGGAEITRVRLINYKPTFGPGEILIFEMNFNEAVDFTGMDVPLIQIFVGEGEDQVELQVPYVSGRGTGTWRFERTIPLAVGGQVTMSDPANLFVGGTLEDVDGQGDPVDFEFTPPSPLPSITLVYPMLNAPEFVGIISTSQDEGPAVTPGNWIDFSIEFRYPITGVTESGTRSTLLCESNGQQFTAHFTGWNDNLLVFSFYVPNTDVYNDEDGIEYISLDLADYIIHTVTGDYTNTVYDMSEVSIATPFVNIDIDPIEVIGVTFSPDPLEAPGTFEITVLWDEDFSSIHDGNPTLTFSVGSIPSASANYLSHVGNQMKFTVEIEDDTFNTTGGGDPFALIGLETSPGSQINTSGGKILGGISGQTVDLSYFVVEPGDQPVIDITV